MSRNIALRQYIISANQLQPSRTASVLTNEIRKMPMYRKRTYKSLHKFVSRTLERGTAEYRSHNRKPSVRTQKNINKVKKLLVKPKKW